MADANPHAELSCGYDVASLIFDATGLDNSPEYESMGSTVHAVAKEAVRQLLQEREARIKAEAELEAAGDESCDEGDAVDEITLLRRFRKEVVQAADSWEKKSRSHKHVDLSFLKAVEDIRRLSAPLDNTPKEQQ